MESQGKANRYAAIAVMTVVRHLVKQVEQLMNIVAHFGSSNVRSDLTVELNNLAIELSNVSNKLKSLVPKFSSAGGMPAKDKKWER